MRKLRILGLLTILMAVAAAPALGYYQSCSAYIIVYSGGGMDCWERCNVYTDEGRYVGRLLHEC